MTVSRQARAIYAQKVADDIAKALKDPGNFMKNKAAEEASAGITIKGGDDDGPDKPIVRVQSS